MLFSKINSYSLELLTLMKDRVIRHYKDKLTLNTRVSPTLSLAYIWGFSNPDTTPFGLVRSWLDNNILHFKFLCQPNIYHHPGKLKETKQLY
jgi:hypothetical protein